MAERAATPARTGGRRRLGPGLTTFLVIDVILVLTFLVLLALHLTSDQDQEAPDAAAQTAAPEQPETTPEQSAPAEPEESETLTEFVLPSGNIHCTMTETSATCTILSFTYAAPEPPPGCGATAGHTLVVEAGSPPAYACDEGPPPAPPEGASTLEYGEGSTIGEMTCLSSENGVFCRHDPSGAGFSVARAGTTFFQP